MSLAAYPTFRAERKGFLEIVPWKDKKKMSESSATLRSPTPHRVPVRSINQVGSTSVLILDKMSQLRCSPSLISPEDVNINKHMALCLLDGMCGFVDGRDLRPRSLPAFYTTVNPMLVSIDDSSPFMSPDSVHVELQLPVDTPFVLQSQPDSSTADLVIILADGREYHASGKHLLENCVPIPVIPYTALASQTAIPVHSASDKGTPSDDYKWEIQEGEILLGIPLGPTIGRTFLWTIRRPKFSHTLETSASSVAQTYLVKSCLRKVSLDGKTSVYSLLEPSDVELRTLSAELLSRNEACLRLRSSPNLPYAQRSKHIPNSMEEDEEESKASSVSEPLGGNLCALWDKSIGPLLTLKPEDESSSQTQEKWLRVVTEGLENCYCQQIYTQVVCLSDLCCAESSIEMDEKPSDDCSIDSWQSLDSISREYLREAQKNHRVLMCLYLFLPPTLLFVLLAASHLWQKYLWVTADADTCRSDLL